MPLLVIVAVAVVGAVVGAGKKSGAFEKGADTTYIDTVRFERQAAEREQERAAVKSVRLLEKENEYVGRHPENKHADPVSAESETEHPATFF
jgi:hypothetical protein